MHRSVMKVPYIRVIEVRYAWFAVTHPSRHFSEILLNLSDMTIT